MAPRSKNVYSVTNQQNGGPREKTFRYAGCVLKLKRSGAFRARWTGLAKKPETKFKEKIAPLLRRLPNSYFVKIQQVAINGTLDYHLCINGHFVALELKESEGAKISATQAYNIQKIVDAKGIALVTYPDNWPDIYKKLLQLAGAEHDGTNENWRAKKA